MITQSEPSRAEIQSALNGVVRDMLCPGAALVAAAHVCYVLAHAVMQPAATRHAMMLLDGLTSLLMVALCVFFAKVAVPPERAHLFGGLMIGLVFLDFAAQTALVSNPDLPVFLMVAIVASGCFLLSWGWLTAAVLSFLAVWVLEMLLHPAGDGWRYSHFLLVAVMVSLLTHWLRRKNYGDNERVKLQLRTASQRLEDRLKFEQVLTMCSTRLLNSSGDEIDHTLLEAMGAVGEWLRVDHVSVCRVDGAPLAFQIMHEWCAEGVSPRKSKMDRVPTSLLPWCWDRLKADENVQICRLGELDAAAATDKSQLQQNGVRSLFAVPLASQGRTWGVLALLSERREIDWSSETARLLRVLGEIILAAVHRKDFEIEIAHLNQQLQKASRLVGLGEMAASLAHDLSNGVSAISQFTQGAHRRAERGTLTLDKCRECIADIGEQAQSLADILRTILEFARTRSSRKSLVHLAELIQQSELLVRGKLRQKSVRLEPDLPPDLPPLCADGSQITIVLVNLILNAAQAMEQTPHDERSIAISAQRSNAEFVEVSLRDSGTGIPEELREKVFEKFYTTKAEGLGLGLAFSRFYIEQHGGRIWCHPKHNSGCDMRFMLPIAKDSAKR